MAALITVIFLCTSLCIVSASIDCNFEEEDLCGWENNNWVRTKYGSPYVSYSGPQNAISGEYYIYFDPNGSDGVSTATLTSPEFNMDTTNCLTFQYHMFGIDVDELKLVIEGNNSVEHLFRSDKGNMWYCFTVDLLSAGGTGKVQFIAKGDGQYGVIALDGIRVFRSESCTTDGQVSNGTCIIDLDSGTTTTTTQSYSSGTTTEVTASTLETTTEDPFIDKLPYIVAVPAAVLLLIIPIVCCAVYRKRKRNRYNEDIKLFPDIMSQNVPRPSMTPSERYPSLPGMHNDVTLYDVIPADREDHEHNYVSGLNDDYLKPRPSVPDVHSGDQYITPVSRSEDGYYILPAITVGQNRESTSVGEGQLRPSGRSGKTSISEQGNVIYSRHIVNSKIVEELGSSLHDYIDPI